MKMITKMQKTIEFEARISTSFDILASNLASKLYAKLLASWGGHITLRLRLLHKCESGFSVTFMEVGVFLARVKGGRNF